MITDRRSALWFALILAGIAIWLCLDMLLPFLKPLFFAAFIAIAAYPLHTLVKRHIPGENRPALVSTLLILLTVVLPTILLTMVVVDQARALFSNLVQFVNSGGLDRLLERIHNSPLVARFGVNIPTLAEFQDLIRSNAERLGRMGLSLAGNVIGNVTGIFVQLFFTMFFLFFVFRDGAQLYRRLASWTPLTIEQTNRLRETVQNAMTANVYGILAVGAAQGLLTTAAFALLGLPAAVFWGFCAAIGSLLPPLGATAIWLPTSIYLLATGSIGKAIFLFCFGAGVISTSDNIIRPLVIHGRVQMGTLTILIALLGGVQAFGLIGLFAGPLIFAVTVELLRIVREELDARAAASRVTESAHARQP